MDKQHLIRAALGNIASLGDIYDARTDNFCGTTIFKKEIPASAISSIDNHFSDVQFVNSDTLSDKLHVLNINGELKLSILAGLFPLSGSGKYLKDEKVNCKTFTRSLLYNITTVDEKVNIFAEKLRDCFSIDSLQSGFGTHVLVGSSWGANSLITAEYQNTEKIDFKTIEGCLQAKLDKLAITISGKAGVSYQDKENKTDIDFKIKIFGDVLPQDEAIPTTWQEAVQLMKKMPALVKSCNSGKGKPLKYTLIPLDVLSKYLNLDIHADIILTKLGEDFVVKVVHIFDNISLAKQQVNDFCDEVLKHTFCLPQTKIEQIQKIKKDFQVSEGKFCSDLASILPEVRSGTVDIARLEEAITEYIHSEYSCDKVVLLLNSVAGVSEKMAFADSLLNQNVYYIGCGKTLDTEMLKSKEQPQAVFYFTESLKAQSRDIWIENRYLFYDMMKKGDYILFAVDCDIHPELFPTDGISVATYKNGKLVCKNLVEKQKSESNISFARCCSPLDRLAQKPNNKSVLNIICPGNDCNPTNIQNWVCERCYAVIEYEFNSYFYCSCGKGRAADFEFKCNGSNHGPDYVKFTPEDLAKLLGKPQPSKELNILLLGETGVGKSTWINAFFNYLSYESLADAKKNEILSVIPSVFSMFMPEKCQRKVVSIGASDPDEVPIPGESATQQTKVYPFTNGDTLIRLIDTPGIGDARGIDQDKKHLENILDTLSYLDELHGICILLTPNVATLNTVYSYCIREILTHLHKNACHNIMFCFTNSQTNIYSPVDIINTLRELLPCNESASISLTKNIFYYDNEWYRFLAAWKSGVNFSAEAQINFATIWNKSFDETLCMLQHIQSLTPHPIKSTISLNESRQFILTLDKFLAEIEIRKSKTYSATNVLAKQELEDRIKAYQQEQKKIEQAIEKFASFLKSNAITPYNDAMFEYMDHQIKEEEEKVAAEVDPKIYEGMKATRNGYKLQFDILEKAIARGGTEKVLTPEEVCDEVVQLGKLHHFGQELKDAFNSTRIVYRNAGRYNPEPITTKWQTSFIIK